MNGRPAPMSEWDEREMLGKERSLKSNHDFTIIT